jgi:uncharacterized protein DUF4019
MSRISRSALAGMAVWLSIVAGSSAQTPPAGGAQPTPAPEAATTPAPAPGSTDQLGIATTLAQQWIALVDEGKYPESWTAAGKLFQANMPQEKWSQVLTGARKPFGKVVSREVAGREIKTDVPGAPPGQYALVGFNTNFEHKPDMTETVTLILEEDGQWRVVGYSANPKPAEGQAQTPPAAQPTPTPTPTPPPGR